jgi:hypothetical protein
MIIMLNYLSTRTNFDSCPFDLVRKQILYSSKTQSHINMYIFQPCLFSFNFLSTASQVYISSLFSQIMYVEKKSLDSLIILLPSIYNRHLRSKYLTYRFTFLMLSSKISMLYFHWMDIYVIWNSHLIV